jgi:RNA polymerase sigma-70 factor (ECF subfamily)
MRIAVIEHEAEVRWGRCSWRDDDETLWSSLSQVPLSAVVSEEEFDSYEPPSHPHDLGVAVRTLDWGPSQDAVLVRQSAAWRLFLNLALWTPRTTRSEQACLDDRQLLLAARSHDGRPAFEQLVDRLTPPLTARARRLVAPVYADDLVQETWLRAWRARDTYRGESSPLAWLGTIMANHAARNRSLRLSPSLVSTEDLAAVAGPDEIPHFEVADAIDRALDRLTPRQAALVRQRHLAEHDWESICASLGYDSPRHAQRALQEAMQHLAKLHRQQGSRLRR